jgi:phage-related minor tail protein
MVSLGEAVVEVGADGGQFTQDVRGFLQDSRSQFARGGDAAGSDFGGGLSKGVKAPLAGVAAIAGTAFAAAGVAAGAAFIGGLREAMSQEDVNARLEAALGATPEQGEKFGKLTADLYKDAFGESLGEVSTAVENVAAAFPKLGEEAGKGLQEATEHALNFSKIFGTDVESAVSAASVTMSSGLASDAEEAFDLMTAASQRVAPKFRDDLLESATEYGTFFNTLGIDGPQAFGLLANGAELGQFGIDKVGDAIKELTIRATDGSTTTVDAFDAIGLNAANMATKIAQGGEGANEAFGQIVKGLQGIEDPAEQAQTAIGLFGTPLEDLNVAQIPQFLDALSSGEDGLENFDGAVTRAGDTLNDTAQTRLTAFTRGIQQGFVELIGGQVLPVFDQFIQSLSTGNASMSGLSSTLTNAQPFITGVSDAFMSAWEAVQGFLVPALTNVKEVFERDVLPAINEFLPVIQPVVEFLVKDFVNAIGSAFTLIADVVAAILKIFSGLLTFLTGVFTGDWEKAWEGVKKIFEGVWDVVLAVFNFVINRITGQFRSQVSQIPGIWSNAWNSLGRIVSNALSNARNAVIQRVVNILSVVRSLPGRIKSALGNLGSLLYSAGQQAIQGLINGVRSYFGNLASAAAGAAQTIRNYFPFSPAKEGPLSGTGSPEHSGEAIAQMLASGIERNVNLPAQAASNALAPLSPTGSALSPLTRAPSGSPAPPVSAGAQPATSPASIQVNQNYFGPTTSGGRLREIDWTIRYAVAARQETGAGEAFAG